jgi:hypothetical protein
MLAATCAAASGCGDGAALIPPACRDGGCQSQRSESSLFQQSISRDIDILFVIDDTPATTSRADALAASFSNAAMLLGPNAGAAAGAPSVHAAFVPASLPAAASPSSRAASCGVATASPFLATGRCGRMPNTTRPFQEAFACMANLGNGSTGTLQPFTATRRALDGGPAALAGFLRPNAYLLVFIVAGDDDASPSDTIELVRFLKSLKVDPNKVAVSIVGPPVEGGDAGPARLPPRLYELVQSFGPNGVYASLGTDDAVAKGLAIILRGGESLDGFACLRAVRDVDPTVPGLQAECVVEDLTYAEVDGGFSSSPMRTILADCEHGAPPCWRLAPAAFCGPDGVQISFDRGPDWCPQDGLDVLVTCLSCLHADDPACHGG